LLLLLLSLLLQLLLLLRQLPLRLLLRLLLLMSPLLCRCYTFSSSSCSAYSAQPLSAPSSATSIHEVGISDLCKCTTLALERHNAQRNATLKDVFVHESSVALRVILEVRAVPESSPSPSPHGGAPYHTGPVLHAIASLVLWLVGSVVWQLGAAAGVCCWWAPRAWAS
jgi:hypothetical protein